MMVTSEVIDPILLPSPFEPFEPFEFYFLSGSRPINFDNKNPVSRINTINYFNLI